MTSEKVMAWLLKIVSACYWFALLIWCLAVLANLFTLNNIGTYAQSVMLPVSLDEESYTITPKNPEFTLAELDELEAKIIYEGGFGFSDKLEFALILILSLGFYVVVLHRLRAVLRSILMSKRITARAVFDMRLVGGFVILAYLSRYLWLLVWDIPTVPDFEFTGALAPAKMITQNYDLDVLSGLLPGLIILVVAEVMNYARKLELERDSLREEQALTV